LKKPIIESNLIIKITHQVPIREKAFFTIIRQSGLTPKAIKELKIKSLEPTATIPRRIDIDQELKQGTNKKPPHFIGEEANKYLTRYLATRNKLTPESLLFSAKNNPNKKINTKNVSRAFRTTLEKIDKRNIGRRKFSLFSLVEFYRESTKAFKTEIDKNPNRNDEYYRKLYKEKALTSLEIESQLVIKTISTKKRYQREIDKRDSQIVEMEQTIARDSEYISSILSLIYSNKGDPETHENEEIGDRFIKLWKEVSKLQIKNLEDVWKSEGKVELLPMLDIVEELTKTLKRIKKPYDEIERQTTHDLRKG
jgi:hypothetical protein